MNRLFPCLLVLLILPASGCKGTEDYLYDLNQSYDKGAKRLRPEVYDAGQLVHEAFAGLSEQEALTLSQMARAVAAGGYVVAMDRDAVPLLQSQAVMILARLALRYPIPPVSEPTSTPTRRRSRIWSRSRSPSSATNRSGSAFPRRSRS